MQPLSEMEVTGHEQRSYVKTVELWGRNAKDCHLELTEDLGNRALHTEQSLDGQLHSSVGELLVPTCVEQDIQELCAPMLRVL